MKPARTHRRCTEVQTRNAKPTSPRPQDPPAKELALDAYDYCRYLAEEIGPRPIGSAGEKRAGDWVEAQLSRMGYETRQLYFDCPSWEYEDEELFVAGEPKLAQALKTRLRLADVDLHYDGKTVSNGFRTECMWNSSNCL